jgi:Domain of Unknown Function (DUF1080)
MSRQSLTMFITAFAVLASAIPGANLARGQTAEQEPAAVPAQEPEADPAIVPDDNEEGFVPLFDGHSLAGWHGEEGLWRVEDGTIIGQTKPDQFLETNSFLVCEHDLPGDFELRVSFRMVAGNSGIQFRAEEDQPNRVRGYQADIDANGTYMGIIYEERKRGILCQRGEAVTIDANGERPEPGKTGLDEETFTALATDGEWHEYRISAVGSRIELMIDGHPTAVLDDQQADAASTDGILALQMHANQVMHVEFRNIRIRAVGGE